MPAVQSTAHTGRQGRQAPAAAQTAADQSQPDPAAAATGRQRMQVPAAAAAQARPRPRRQMASRMGAAPTALQLLGPSEHLEHDVTQGADGGSQLAACRGSTRRRRRPPERLVPGPEEKHRKLAAAPSMHAQADPAVGRQLAAPGVSSTQHPGPVEAPACPGKAAVAPVKAPAWPGADAGRVAAQPHSRPALWPTAEHGAVPEDVGQAPWRSKRKAQAAPDPGEMKVFWRRKRHRSPSRATGDLVRELEEVAGPITAERQAVHNEQRPRPAGQMPEGAGPLTAGREGVQPTQQPRPGLPGQVARNAQAAAEQAAVCTAQQPRAASRRQEAGDGHAAAGRQLQANGQAAAREARAAGKQNVRLAGAARLARGQQPEEPEVAGPPNAERQKVYRTQQPKMAGQRTELAALLDNERQAVQQPRPVGQRPEAVDGPAAHAAGRQGGRATGAAAAVSHGLWLEKALGQQLPAPAVSTPHVRPAPEPRHAGRLSAAVVPDSAAAAAAASAGHPRRPAHQHQTGVMLAGLLFETCDRNQVRLV